MSTQTKKWFGVKLLYRYRVEGKPDPLLIDENFIEDYLAYEESIMLVEATSFDDAYKLAETRAEETEFEYENIYRQKVFKEYFDAIDCFFVGDELPGNGTEIYSNLIEVNTKVNSEKYLDYIFPVSADKKYMLLNR